MKKLSKKRMYKLVFHLDGLYGFAVEQKRIMPFRDINQAYEYLYSKNYKPLKVKFVGWGID